jgi:molybdate transport system substrate-binding protein
MSVALSTFQSASFAQKPELLVAAASDLSHLAEPLAQAFPQINLKFTFGSSGMLAQQIEAGAPFDVFLSANEKFIEQLVTTGKIDREDVQVYATGRLALWSKSSAIKSLEDLNRFSALRLSIANPLHAPYGMAAQQLLEKTGLWERLKPGLVLGENVRQALQFAESGNVDAVITAWSLVHDRGGILLPGNLHQPIRQVGAEVKRSKQRKLARRFVEFLSGPDGRKLLSEHGFIVSSYAPTLKR